MKNKSNKINKTNDMSDAKNMIFLNGPINYFKLSNAKSEINIFMDFHAPISRQRKCEDYESKDIDKYFLKILSDTTENTENINKDINKDINTTLDFFLEINPTSINFKNKYYSNDNYLVSIRKMFSKLYNQKYSNLDEEDMPQQRIRLHYMDIRDYSSFNELKYKLEVILLELDDNKLDNLIFVNEELRSIKNILVFIDSMIKSIISNDKKNIYSSLSTKKIDFINITEKITVKNNTSKTSTSKDLLSNNHAPDTNGQNITKEQILNVNVVKDIGLYQILQKILLNYKNSDNRDNVINLFTEHYIKTSKYIIGKLEKLMISIVEVNKAIQDYIIEEKITFEEINSNKKDGSRDISPYYFFSMSKYKQYLRNIVDEIEEINHLIIKMGVIMTDCYFLRRLTDNSNIKKSIIYTGAYHSAIYLWFLVKYNGYKIDDYYYLKENTTVTELTQIIKKSDYLDILKYVIPDKVNQCIKIKEL
jgi:hypothetical protein